MEEWQAITTLKNVVLSSRETTKKVKVSVSTVSFNIKRHSETGWNRKKFNRPKAKTESENKFLRANSLHDRLLTGQQLQAQLNSGRSEQIWSFSDKRTLSCWFGRTSCSKKAIDKMSEDGNIENMDCPAQSSDLKHSWELLQQIWEELSEECLIFYCRKNVTSLLVYLLIYISLEYILVYKLFQLFFFSMLSFQSAETLNCIISNKKKTGKIGVLQSFEKKKSHNRRRNKQSCFCKQ